MFPRSSSYRSTTFGPARSTRRGLSPGGNQPGVSGKVGISHRDFSQTIPELGGLGSGGAETGGVGFSAGGGCRWTSTTGTVTTAASTTAALRIAVRLRLSRRVHSIAPPFDGPSQLRRCGGTDPRTKPKRFCPQKYLLRCVRGMYGLP